MSHPELRDPRGWNAGLVQALTLPDGPFKLYVWLRLNVRLETGSIEISQSDLAKALKKAHGTIRANLKVLEEANVCQTSFSRNPQGRGYIELTDDYWPYRRDQSSKVEDPEVLAYIDQVRMILYERACIRKPMLQTDEAIARQWHAQGIPIEHVRRAVLMGCGRKYVSWRNGGPRTPIGSLAYFQPLLEEVRRENAPAEYWSFILERIERTERLWVNDHDPERLALSIPSKGPEEKEREPE